MCKMTNNSETGGRILVPQGMCSDIQRVLGYSQPTIRRALRGANDTLAARNIRKFAMENGGSMPSADEKYVRVDVRTLRLSK